MEKQESWQRTRGFFFYTTSRLFGGSFTFQYLKPLMIIYYQVMYTVYGKVKTLEIRKKSLSHHQG